jgi:hypothetical protein
MAQSIMVTYPGFYALPAGVKKLLLESESFFFAETRPNNQAAAERMESFAPWMGIDSTRYRRVYGWDNRAAA